MYSYSRQLEFPVSTGVMMMFSNEQVISYGHEFSRISSLQYLRQI